MAPVVSENDHNKREQIDKLPKLDGQTIDSRAVVKMPSAEADFTDPARLLFLDAGRRIETSDAVAVIEPLVLE